MFILCPTDYLIMFLPPKVAHNWFSHLTFLCSCSPLEIIWELAPKFSLHTHYSSPHFSLKMFIPYPRDLVRLCLQNFPHLSTSENLIFTPKYSFCPLQITSSFTPQIFLPVKYWLFSPKHHLSFSSKISPFLFHVDELRSSPSSAMNYLHFAPQVSILFPTGVLGTPGRSLCPHLLSNHLCNIFHVRFFYKNPMFSYSDWFWSF